MRFVFNVLTSPPLPFSSLPVFSASSMPSQLVFSLVSRHSLSLTLAFLALVLSLFWCNYFVMILIVNFFLILVMNFLQLWMMSIGKSFKFWWWILCFYSSISVMFSQSGSLCSFQIFFAFLTSFMWNKASSFDDQTISSCQVHYSHVVSFPTFKEIGQNSHSKLLVKRISDYL